MELKLLYIPSKIFIDYNRGQNCWDDWPFPLPPGSMLRYRAIGQVRQPNFVRGGGGGVISPSHMISSAWELSTEFVVRVFLVTGDYEAAFQLILTRIVGPSSHPVGLGAAVGKQTFLTLAGRVNMYTHSMVW